MAPEAGQLAEGSIGAREGENKVVVIGQAWGQRGRDECVVALDRSDDTPGSGGPEVSRIQWFLAHIGGRPAERLRL